MWNPGTRNASIERGSRPREWGWAWCALVGVAIGLVTFPAPSAHVAATLDGGYVYELGRLRDAGFRFGRDVFYTYGPLGELLEPTTAGALRAGAVLRWCIQALTAIGIAVQLRRAGPFAAAVCAAGLVLSSATWLLFEYQVLLPVVLLSAAAATRGRALPFAAAAAIAAFLLFLKTTVGVAAIGAVAIAAVAGVAVHRRAFAPALVAAAAAWAAVAGVLGSILFGRASEAVAWFSAALEIGSEYSVAMSTAGERVQLVTAAALVAMFLVTAALVARRPAALTVAAVLLPTLFVAFKHGFVRHDVWHLRAFFPWMLVVAAIWWLFVDAAVRWRLLPFTAAAAAASVWYGLHGGIADTASLRAAVARIATVQSARYWAVPPPAQDVAAAVAADFLPGLRDEVGNEAMAVVPWELTRCPANGIACVPSPTLELFQAYTARLDRLTASHYSAATAPRFVLAEFQSIDGHNLVADTPATWAAILEWYEPARDFEAAWLLRRRRAPARTETLSEVRAVTTAGAWALVPSGEGRVRVGIDLDLRPVGRIARTLFQVPRIDMDVLDCRGGVRSFRVVPDTARNGIAIDAIAVTPREFGRVLHGELPPAPVAIRLSGPGLAFYRQPIPLTFRRSSGERRGDACASALGDLRGLSHRPTPVDKPLLFVDRIGDSSPPAANRVVVDAAREPLIPVSGWAVDPLTSRAARAIVISEGDRQHWIPCGFERPDVRDHFGVDAYASSGCSGLIPAAELGIGEHTLRFHVVAADGDAFYGDARTVVVSVR